MEVEVVGEEAEEVEVTTNKRGVAAAAIEEVDVVKTAHNIVELRTSERNKKSTINYGLTKYIDKEHTRN